MEWRNRPREEKREIINSRPLTDFYPLEPSKYGFFVCPLCGSGSGNHSHYNGALRIKANRVVCFACGKFSQGGHNSTDTLGALELILGFSENQVFDYVAQELGEEITTSRPPEKREPPAAERKQKEVDFSGLYKKAQEELFSSPDALLYLRARGITEDSIRRFRLGYSEQWRSSKAGPSVPFTSRIIIPRNDYSYLARRIDGISDYEKMLDGPQALFNARDSITGVCFVVEGEVDAISMLQLGAMGCVGLGSLSNMGMFVKYLLPGSRNVYVLALDNDEPGRKAQLSLAQQMQEEGLQVFNYDPAFIYGGLKDANECLIRNGERLRTLIQRITEKGLKDIKERMERE